MGVYGAFAQQAVALFERAGVADEVVEIDGVALRNHHVNPVAPLLAALPDEVDVLRGYHHEWETAYVGTETFIFLASAFEGLAAGGGEAERKLLVDAFADVGALGYGEVLSATYEHPVGDA